MELTTEEKLVRSLQDNGLADGGTGWLAEIRGQALRRFREHGLPTRRVENWKYTSLNALGKLELAEQPASAPLPDRVPSLLAASSAHPRLVFLDGKLAAPLSRLDGLPEGATLSGLSSLEGEAPEWLHRALGQVARPSDGSALLDLNSALFSDAALLHLAAGVRVEQPIEIVDLQSTGDDEAPASLPRLLVLLEDNSEASLVELHASIGDGAAVSSGVAEIRLQSGARLKHLRVQERGSRSHHFANSQIEVGRGSSYEGYLMILGAALSREDIGVRLMGEGANCRLGGAYLLEGRQHADITSVIEHEAPHSTCDEAIKGALDGQSRGVFQGLIRVQAGAQKIVGNQNHRALLLSPGAEVDAKPELEIYADDVKCSHGATVGALDESALFYLRSRGIGERRAQELLIEAFLRETLEFCGETSLREPLGEKLSGKLRAMTGEAR